MKEWKMGVRWRGWGLEVCLSVVLIIIAAIIGNIEAEQKGKTCVITLDHSNFAHIVSKHDFILVQFYAPWCGFCKRLAPEYEKAAVTLSKHDPSIPLAKVDLTTDENKEYFKSMFEVRGFPTLKILRNGGKLIHHITDTPQSADEIVKLVEKFLGPASVEIKSYADSSKYIDEKQTFVAGVFTKFEGEEFENFTKLADKLRSEYEFGHTLNAKFLPRGPDFVKGSIVRFLKPFDERFVDTKNFDLDSLEKFIKEEDMPTVVPFNMDPSNTYLRKIFREQNAKIFMILDTKSGDADIMKSKFNDVAVLLKGGNRYFILADVEESKELLESFKLDQSHTPFIFIYENDDKKYRKTNLKPDEVALWFRDYMTGRLEVFMRSQSIPLENNEPVKVVVLDSLQDMVFNSGKDVFLEFYAPWCGHCKQLAPILEEVAISYEKDTHILIAKYDKSENDIPSEVFEVQDTPTMYFIKKGGEIIEYNGGKTKEDIIRFIEEHRNDRKSKSEAEKESNKDEL
ncbi:unnamed protein product [Amaranthus hypochondriacus]